MKGGAYETGVVAAFGTGDAGTSESTFDLLLQIAGRLDELQAELAGLCRQAEGRFADLAWSVECGDWLASCLLPIELPGKVASYASAVEDFWRVAKTTLGGGRGLSTLRAEIQKAHARRVGL